MKTVSITDILNNKIQKNTEIIIQGWIRTRRDSKTKISFLDVYDGSNINPLQVIASNKLNNYKSEILHLTSGCSVSIKGIIAKSIGSKQYIELIATNITVLGWVDHPNTYPIAAKKHTMEYLRNFAHLRPRTNIIGSISRIRHTVLKAIHNFMDQKGFIWIPTPIITASDTEGTGKMFHVSTLHSNKHLFEDIKNKKNYHHNFFGKTALLTVSGQLNAESYACALSKVYTFGPTFRAEESNTHRHLSEFWMIEPEIAFATLDDIIVLAESLLKNTVKLLLTERLDDIQYLSEKQTTEIITKKQNMIERLKNFINKKFVCIEYTEAIKLLRECNQSFYNPIHWGSDLFSEHEKYLSDIYFQSPVIIKNYPKKIKAFYMRLNDDQKTVASMDILVPSIGEIIGGSQREERLSILDQQIQEKNLSKEHYWWYRDLRRYGTVPHAGFGLGFERLIAYITGIKNIRDIAPFPRTPKNLNF